jgi:hypothetical protein
MTMQKATIGAVVAVAMIGIMMSAIGALVATRTISSSGNITGVGVGVYSDSGCTTTLSSISWGTLNPGNSTTYTMYVKNTGNVQETLNMTVNGWNPASASSYITLTWNQEKSVLNAGQHVTAVLTLSVSSSISNITSFSNNIIITGTH